MNFQELELRFVGHLRERVRSGELTERGLARIIGVSQPHLHNVLKGKRFFSHDRADAVLQYLRLDIRDFIQPDEFDDRRR